MTKLATEDCFQCGKPRIITKTYKEYVNGSLVVSSESICSDPACQKRTTDALESERRKRESSQQNKLEHAPKKIEKKASPIAKGTSKKNFL